MHFYFEYIYHLTVAMKHLPLSLEIINFFVAFQHCCNGNIETEESINVFLKNRQMLVVLCSV